MTLPEHPVTATALRKYDQIYIDRRWRSVISADLTIPPTEDEIVALRQQVAAAPDGQELMNAAFELGYSVKRRMQWDRPVVRVQLGTAGGIRFKEYAPDDLVTVRRPG